MDSLVQDWIAHGFVCLQPTHLPQQFHDEIYTRCMELATTQDDSGQSRCTSLGDDLQAELPEVNHIWDCPLIRVFLRRILGDFPIMDPHKFCHLALPERQGQGLHVDQMQSTSGHYARLPSRPFWVLAMYYPQTTTIELGPTGIMPGSHFFWNEGKNSPFQKKNVSEVDIPTLARQWGLTEQPCECPKGSILFCHYDLWHRGLARGATPLSARFMLKFIWTRSHLPSPRSALSPTHPLQTQSLPLYYTSSPSVSPPKPWSAGAYAHYPHCLRPLWQDTWNWLHGAFTCSLAPTPLTHLPPLPQTRGGPEEVAWVWAAATTGAPEDLQKLVRPPLISSQRELKPDKQEKKHEKPDKDDEGEEERSVAKDDTEQSSDVRSEARMALRALALGGHRMVSFAYLCSRVFEIFV